jgi:hypothetical protein
MAANAQSIAQITPREHFRACFCAAVDHLTAAVTEMLGSREETLRQFPFLDDYADAIPARREDGSDAPSHLPLSALQDAAALSDGAISLLMAIGLIEEDARFGPLFEALQNTPGQHHPTQGLLTTLWRSDEDCVAVRSDLRRLREFGLVEVINPEAPRLEWALAPATVLWDVLRGETPEMVARWARLTPADKLPGRDALVVPPEVLGAVTILPSLLESQDVRAIVVRGPRHNGRRTLLGSLAKEIGRGILEIAGPLKPDDEHLRIAGPLATALHAMPVFEMTLAPGESAEIPQLTAYDGPIGVVLERYGGVTGSAMERTFTLTLDLPGPSVRREHWRTVLGAGADLDGIAGRFRISVGNIRRAGAIARSHAIAAGRAGVSPTDVREASRSLNRQALETIAANVPCSGGWQHMAAPDETVAELRSLESRCRHREKLRDQAGSTLGGNLNCGVRALFSGPSGTGKTMAARLLASALDMDLYRVDLSSVVNKYIGETEKNLNQAFSRAEELDVILLLDEGDALLTSRTSVQTSNDRYANLETNFLLQRIEAFDGILLVTTNAAGRIDSAFQRRMDVVVDFRAPEPNERWLIWQIHLPENHQVDPRWLEEAALRCVLTGGQIRNAVLHASLLALSHGGRIGTAHAEEAVRREYRKTGAVCPLRRLTTGSR